MADIQSPRVLYFKGGLFLFLGALAAGLLLAEHASWKFAALLALAIWSFARAYYFVFYVIEHYIDPGFKFSGLWAFAHYLLRRKLAICKAEIQASVASDASRSPPSSDPRPESPTLPGASAD
jgi:hypothetical protein